tara:strand:- start:144 stop:371 length:228 start_codon:yes stop_codon:yes gene_type:complete
MANANKELLDKAFDNPQFKKQIFDVMMFGAGFVELGFNGVKHLTLNDVLISCYESLLRDHKEKDLELVLSNQLEF